MREMREMQFSWERELPGTPEQVWDAITVHSDGWLWPIAYEPRVGGAERGLTSDGGAVTTWEPARRFGTRAERPDGWFNELGYELEPSGAGTRARYRHATVTGPDEDHDLMARACDLHTDFYGHSLGEYVEHFAGRDAAYASLDAPDASAQPGGFERLLRALGLDDAAVGARVALRPAGLPPIDAVVSYRTPHFLGLRTGDGLIRIFGRDTFGWPVGVTLHLFAPDADATALQQAWRAWLEGVYATEGSVA